VNPDNCAAILALPDVDGALVGGASLEAGSFAAIVSAAGQGLVDSTGAFGDTAA
jgi:triosephosphate isomerase